MFEKRLLFPHQYYYPNMNFLRDRSTREKEERFYKKCLSLGTGPETGRKTAGRDAGAPRNADTGRDAGAPRNADAGRDAGTPRNADTGRDAGAPRNADAGSDAGGTLNTENIPSPDRRMATIYIHIPFCNSKCAFCGFDKEYELDEMSAYVDKVLTEMQYYADLLADKYLIQSVHFGGGTPTILPGAELQRLLDGVKSSFCLAPDCAVDAEGSATTMYRDDIIDFVLRNRLTRMSFGIQTFNEQIRREMTMKATVEDVMYSLKVLKQNGIRIFGDILYGYPDFGAGDLIQILRDDIDTSIAVGLDGVEFGQMYPFKNELERIVRERGLVLPRDEDIIEMIEIGTEKLLAAGYTQTTYSGFVKQGKIILETSYFGGIEEMPDCIAMGSGAFGNIAGFKYRNASYNVYMHFDAPCYGQLKEMTPEQIENMQIVGFPKVLVLNKQLLEKESVRSRFAEKFAVLKREGYIDENEHAWFLTHKGKNYIDNIYWYLLEDEEKKNLEKEIVVYVSQK